MQIYPFMISSITISNCNTRAEATEKVIDIVGALTNKSVYVESFSAKEPCVVIQSTSYFISENIMYAVFNIQELR